MAELNLDYYTAKDHYSDGDIEETLLKMAQEGKSFDDLPEEEVSFPMVYHFSGLRENILNWYPLKKADSVLEIGAGCGAITGMLCRKAGHVTSVELSKRRADINYARNRYIRFRECETVNTNTFHFFAQNRYFFEIRNHYPDFANIAVNAAKRAGNNV